MNAILINSINLSHLSHSNRCSLARNVSEHSGLKNFESIKAHSYSNCAKPIFIVEF